MMRITTQMLNRTAARTGIPIMRNGLINYMNQTQSSGNTLLDSLRKNSQAAAGTQTQKMQNYKDLEKAADQLQASADKLTASGENSLYEKAKESGDRKELDGEIKKFVENYNSALSKLDKDTSTLGAYYKQMLQEASKENSDALSGIGISVDKNGKLSIDNEKLEKASVDDIQKSLGSSGMLASKASFLADRIAGNAQANAYSASGQYDQFGSMIAQMMGSRYNFWG